MRPFILCLLLVGGLGCAVARAGAPAEPAPGDASFVGTVSYRLGLSVVVALRPGAQARAGEQLTIGRYTLLVTVAKGGELVELWDRWVPTGRIRVRSLRGDRYLWCLVDQETPRIGVGGEPVPNIRPGDVVHRAEGAGPASPKPGGPPGSAGPQDTERKPQ